MTEDKDLRERFDALRGAVAPLDHAPATIDRAVARRRRRPLAVAGGLAGAAAVTAVAVALVPGLGLGLGALSGGSGAASMTTETTAESTDVPLETDAPSLGFVPLEMSGETVGEWAAWTDVLVVVESDGDQASVTDVPWRRTTQPDSPAGSFGLEALPLGEGGEILLRTALGTPPEPTLEPGSGYLVALRWEQVRCDGAAAGWVLLGDDAVLGYADGVVLGDGGAPVDPVGEPLPDLGTAAVSAFAGLTAVDAGTILDELRAAHEIERARGLCQ